MTSAAPLASLPRVSWLAAAAPHSAPRRPPSRRAAAAEAGPESAQLAAASAAPVAAAAANPESADGGGISNARFSDLRQDVKEDITEIRNEVKNLQTDLKGDMKAVDERIGRAEVKLSADMTKLRDDLTGWKRWAIATIFTLAGGGAMLTAWTDIKADVRALTVADAHKDGEINRLNAEINRLRDRLERQEPSRRE